MNEKTIIDGWRDGYIFHFHAHGTGGTLCGTENIRLLIGHSNHEHSVNLGPCDVRCWHYTNKGFK